MKIAIPYQGGYVNDNLGSSSEFIVIEAENGIITGKKILTSGADHGNLVSMLQAEGVEVIIANLISRPLTEMLFYNGMRVITRASGEAEKVAKDFLSGNLVTGAACRDGGNHGHESSF
ncbi:MAG: NifB/NifX family molybdenum-iron cluster-binding protein [Desulfotomaculaceae bacterium]|nr:NifB/NifX family molybdenum-iron cluster-binding protein [Desulfotomaculaceae bacterium]